MDGRHNGLGGFFAECCLGRRKKEEPVELTRPRRNAYGQKLKENLDNNRAERVDGPSSMPRGDVSKPLPASPPGPGRASLDLGKPRHPSTDLSDLVTSDAEDASIPRRYDRAWYEMLSSLHNALKHTKYSISGRMGMSIWGCSIGAKNGLSIVCPNESRQAVKIWCISTGGRFRLTESEPDVLVFQAPDANYLSRSRTWRIRIRWLPEAAFEAMPKIEMALRYDDGNPYEGEQVAEVNVLALPALLDNCADAWADQVRRHGGAVDGRRIRGIEEDIFSILERIIDLNFTEEGSGPLTHLECRHVIRGGFWDPFTAKHKDSPAMFALCGLPLPSPPTRVQPAPSAGMVYPEDDQRFSNPRPAPPVPPRDKDDNQNKASVLNATATTTSGSSKRHSDPEPRPKHTRRASFVELFSSSGRRGSKDAERERRHAEDARRLGEQVGRGARRLEGRERERMRRSPPQAQHRDSKEKEREREKYREGGSSSHRHHRRRGGTDSLPLEKASSSRATADDDGGDVRRHSSPPASSRQTGSATVQSDGTKVSYFDPTSLELCASGKGRIPRRGHFADLVILDDGETL
jgi:hypothetical protein